MEQTEIFWEDKIRPRFKFRSRYSLSEIVDRITIGIHDDKAPCKARIVHDHIVLFFPTNKQHYWSPQLSLSIEEEEQGSLIRGLYGPRPSVWTMFVFFYSFIAFAILFVSIFGFSYMSMGRSGNVLWLIPVLIIIFLSLYRVSSTGKKLGKDEMRTLHKFLESCIRY